ncbi:nucleotidyltransferase domain-containing protein [Curtobacterium sp. NPDC090217]|uniref:nucleotidyltransferase domain-containing protein n=1 Tax=Curtobacterium sp. NPDC090217 TaxID=3363970 RepID=UPI00380E55EA
MTEELPGPISELVQALGAIPTVEAVSLGGSRAHGTARPDSDWDLGVYYRGDFEPDHVRALGYEGTVVDIGEWGGGVFNGGAWLTVGGESVDLLWRDLDVVEHEIAEAEAGRWRTEELMFHLVGIPTYLLVAELARHRVLVGQLPVPTYPEALRAAASSGWAARAELTLQHARAAHAPYGRVTQCLGLIAIGAAEYAHAHAAADAVWVTNDKALLELGHMSAADAVLAAIEPSPAGLTRAVDAVIALGRSDRSNTHDADR